MGGSRLARWLGLATASLVVCLPLLLATPVRAAPAQCPQPVRDRYEPGETVTILGYGCLGGFGWDEVDPSEVPALYGYLEPDPCAARTDHGCRAILYGPDQSIDLSDGIPLGRFTLEETQHELRGLRMSLTFAVPTDLPAGIYYVTICQDPCMGDFTRSSQIYVGLDRPADWPEVRHWPLDDPAIQDLPADALLLGHDGEPVTAAEVRAGITRGNPARPSSAGADRASVRTDAVEAETGHQDEGRWSLWWLGAIAVLVAAAWMVTRVGPALKQVRRPAE